MRRSIDRAIPPGPAPRALGQDIRGLRKARDLTLAELAEASGLSIGYLSLVERDLATPSIKALHAISRALGPPSVGSSRAARCPRPSAASSVRRARRRGLDYSPGSSTSS